MKLPKIRRTYCPKCKKHTEHKVAEVKRRTPFSAHPMARANEPRARKRGKLGMGNWGRYSRPAISARKMYNKKTTKKTDLRYTCSVCKKAHMAGFGWRARRIEFV